MNKNKLKKIFPILLLVVVIIMGIYIFAGGRIGVIFDKYNLDKNDTDMNHETDGKDSIQEPMKKISLEQVKNEMSNSELENYSSFSGVSFIAIKNGEDYIYCDSDIRALPYSLGTEGFSIALLEDYMPVYKASKSSADQLIVFSEYDSLPKEIYRLTKEKAYGYIIPIAVHDHGMEKAYKVSIARQVDPSVKNTDNASLLFWLKIFDGIVGNVYWAQSYDCTNGTPIVSIDGVSIVDWLSEDIIDACAGTCDAGDGGLYGKMYDKNQSHTISFSDGEYTEDVELTSDIPLYEFATEGIEYQVSDEGYVVYDISKLPTGRYVFGGVSGIENLRGVLIDIVE